MREARIAVSETAPGKYAITLVEIGDAGEVELAREDAGDGFTNGFPDLVVEGVPLTAALLVAAYRSSPALDEAQLYGRYLFRLLSPGAIGVHWKNLRQRSPDGLTTLLELGPEAWRALPWELLFDQLFWFHHPRHALGLRLPGGSSSAGAPLWPLRMLVMLGHAPTDPIAAKAEEELLAIRRAICAFSLRIDLRVVRAPLAKLDAGREIETFRPHLFHFIGHGTTDHGGSLSLAQPGGGRPVPWQHAEIAAILAGLHPDEVPRLAVINACEAALAADGSETSVATAFAGIGCPAVIAMQGNILGAAAAAFSRTFYGELARLGMERIDQAYNRALLAVATTQGIDQRVWSLPRLFYQDRAAAVFPLGGESRGFDEAVAGFDDLPEIKPFINHEERRNELYHRAGCWLDAPPQQHRVLLVTGPKGSGKTWLLKAIAYAAALRGHHTRYHDFRERNFELREFLDLIRGGAQGSNRFLSGPLWPEGEAAEPAAAEPAAGDLVGNEDQMSPLAERLAQELRRLGETRRVVLAIDHIARLRTCWQYLRGPLVEAAAKGERPGGLGRNVRLVLAADPNELADFGLGSLSAKKIELPELSADCFEDYVTQYCLFRLREGPAFEENLQLCRETIEQLAANRKRSGKLWRLEQLNDIFDFLGVA